MPGTFKPYSALNPSGRTHRSREFLLFACGIAAALLPYCVFATARQSIYAAEESKPKLEFLVARRSLQDPSFTESVVLMLPSEGLPLVVGLIVNKPTKVTLDKIYSPVRAAKGSGASAYFGGPVDYDSASPSLIFHASKAPAHAIPLFADVYLTFDPDVVAGFLRDPKQAGDFRLILGRAQWAPDQLDDEIQEGSWDRIKAEGSVVFDPDSEHLWRRLHDRTQRLDVKTLLTEPIAILPQR